MNLGERVVLLRIVRNEKPTITNNKVADKNFEKKEKRKKIKKVTTTAPILVGC
ncbi:MAG: hypothetical protein QXG97_07340 [Nitrososphaerota archaeon]